MSLIHRILQAIMGQVARLVCKAPWAIVILSLLLAAGSVYVVATRFNVINNTSDLLSPTLPSKKYYNDLVQEFGSDYRLIVLIQSPDTNKNRQAADEVGKYLESLKPQITTVLSKIDFSNVKPRLLFTRDLDDLKRIANQVESQEKLQKQSAANSEQMALDLNSILDEANRKMDDKYLRDKNNWGNFNAFVDQFVSILNKVAAQADGKTLAQEQSQAAENGSTLDDFDANEMIAEHEYFSLQGGKSVLVFAYTGTPDPDGQAPFSDTVAKVRQHLIDMQKTPAYKGVDLRLTGEPALDADQIITSTSDSIKAGIITVVLIIALFIFSYRTFLRPAFAFFVLIVAVLWSLGFALITVGHFNVLSVAVIPMVLGIGIDFGIQILGRYEEELGHHSDVNKAILQTLQHTGVAIITGGSTTAAAFFSLCFNDFVGLAELGIIAGASMILCITASLLLLPAIFVLRDRKRNPEVLQNQSNNSAWNFIHSWDRTMVSAPRFWIGVAAVISIASILSLPRLAFDYNLLHLQNSKTASVQTLYDVMKASQDDNGTQISTIYASVVANNLDEARAMSDKLKALPEVSRVDSLLELIPLDQDAKVPVIKRIINAANALNVKPSTGKPVDIPRARRDVANLLKETQQGLVQAQGYANVSTVAKKAVAAFNTMIPALERADKALNSAPLAVIQQRFDASSAGAFTRMQTNMELLKGQKDDRGLTLADIPPQLQKLFLAPSGKILLQVYGKKDLWERGPDEEFTLSILKVAPNATGTPVLNYYATDLLRTSYLWAALWAFLTIAVLIFLHFQSFKYLVLTLTPLVLAVLWRTGAMVWFGIEFNPANIVTLPLIIGIDVAFGVYIIDRYREDGRFKIFSESTGKAIIMSSLTSLFGFSSLLVSQFAGMYSIGQLMSLGIAIGLVTAIFFLPQILVLLKPRVDDDSTPSAK
jgi:hopanoid biosynthesis associated RND transporter like protein HpnN